MFWIKFVAALCNNALPTPAQHQMSRPDLEFPGPLFPARDSFPVFQRYGSTSLIRNFHPPLPPVLLLGPTGGGGSHERDTPLLLLSRNWYLLPNNQHQHRTSHAPNKVLPLRLCANYPAACQPLLRAFSGWIRSPPPSIAIHPTATHRPPPYPPAG